MLSSKLIFCTCLVAGIWFGVFWCSMFLFYSVMAVVMRLTNAVVVNLSLLTADFYTLLFGIILFKYQVSVILPSLTQARTQTQHTHIEQNVLLPHWFTVPDKT